MNFKKHNTALYAAPHFFDSFLMKDLFEKPAMPATGSLFPAVNISVNEASFVVEVAAPALKKEAFQLAFDKDVLTISYKEEGSTETKEEVNYLKREFSSRSFSRSFTFPKGVVEDEKIEAQYVDGVLRLELPKKEEAKPKAPRQISIS